MSQSLPPENREPSNAEILETLKGHIERVDARHEHLAGQNAAFHTMLKHQGDQIGVLTKKHADLERELKAVDGRAQRALGAQAELEGSLLREVGVLASNDKKQNAELAKQSGQLAGIVNAVGEIQTWKKAAALLVMGAPGAWLALQQLLEHWK